MIPACIRGGEGWGDGRGEGSQGEGGGVRPAAYLGDGDGLLFHGLVDGDSVILSHLVGVGFISMVTTTAQ